LIEIIRPPSHTPRIAIRTNAASRTPHPFIKGEIVEGKVLKTAPTGESLISIDGKTVSAKSPFQLTAGETLTLRVEEASPLPILKLLGVKGSDHLEPRVPLLLSSIDEASWKALAEAISRLNISQEDRSAFNRLMGKLLQGIYQKGQENILKTLIDLMGLRWEAKLSRHMGYQKGGQVLERLLRGDLKGMVSKLIFQQRGETADLKRFVAVIESLQLLNRMTMEQERSLFLPVPLQFPDGLLSIGQLLIHMPQNGEDGAPETRGKRGGRHGKVRITFLLELSHLGPLRVDLSLMDREISGRFLLSTEEALSRVRDQISSFTQNLIEKGFSIGHLEYECDTPETVKRPLVTQILQMEDRNLSLIA
jgi:hypothetical protein